MPPGRETSRPEKDTANSGPLCFIAEDVRGEVRAVAEGLETLREEMHREFATVRTETARELEETRALIRLSYGELDRRVRGLETEVADLRARLERVEERLAA